MKLEYRLTGKYIVIARLVKNGSPSRYIVSDRNRQRKEMNIHHVMDLASKGKIVNCRVEKGKLKGVGMSLRHLPQYDKKTGIVYRGGKEDDILDNILDYIDQHTYDITARVMKNNNCVGYEVTNKYGKKALFRRADIIQMIVLGYIDNVTYQYYNGRHYIKGVGFSLNKLRVIRD